MFKTLSMIADQLNEQGIVWGVGASILLYQHGLVNNPQDIDLIIDLKDADQADRILTAMGEKRIAFDSVTYSTKVFGEYVINGIDVDLMSGFGIDHRLGTYIYDFDRKSVVDYFKVNTVNIPFTALEDWYVLYALMPGKEVKAKLIEEHLIRTGIKNPTLLEKTLGGNLPNHIVAQIQMLLEVNRRR